ncbi:hypothetical protein GCM10009678_00390 [Actinomadura kijaniata]|uniref:Secreted protein n=1 Tax=Actinomadura namibiensis TaxID=182080 RepID=A0A7W3LSE7_ACTNM|nr:hypothetical protein [Actinomadura namibiensis]MBA8953435.1 hypothetical protein [Actinomadura namibiensis]
MFTKRMASRALTALATVLVGGLIAPPAEAATVAEPRNHKVKVCHRTASDRHPYVLIEVDRDSTKYKGHLAHRNDPGRWKKGRRDYIDGLDGRIDSLRDCLKKHKPDKKPPGKKPPGKKPSGKKPPNKPGHDQKPPKPPKSPGRCRVAAPPTGACN